MSQKPSGETMGDDGSSAIMVSLDHDPSAAAAAANPNNGSAVLIPAAAAQVQQRQQQVIILPPGRCPCPRVILLPPAEVQSSDTTPVRNGHIRFARSSDVMTTIFPREHQKKRRKERGRRTCIARGRSLRRPTTYWFGGVPVCHWPHPLPSCQ